MMTENQQAIARNERTTAELNVGGKITQYALLGIVVALAFSLVVVIGSYSATNKQLRGDITVQETELRCRSEIVNAHAAAHSNISIEDAHNDSVTSRALARIARGEAIGDLLDELEGSAQRLEDLSVVLAAATRARTESVEECQDD
jgi:hypothetical protein